MNKIMFYVFLLGIILTIVGFALLDFDVKEIGNNFNRGHHSLENKSVTFDSEEINIIDLKTRNTKIEIKSSTNNEFKIEYQETDYQKYEYTINNNKLIMKDNQPRKPKLFTYGINFGVVSQQILTIYIPKDGVELSIQTSNASINLTKELNLANAKFVSTNGSIKIENQTIGNKLVAQTTNSRITINDVNVENDISLKTTNGSINTRNVDAKKLNAKTSNSGIKANDINANKITYRTTNGSIEFSNLNAINIKLTSTNDEIEGTIVGSEYDYNKEIQTSNDSIRINNNKFGNTYNKEERDAVRSLTIKTTNDRINIDFTE